MEIASVGRATYTGDQRTYNNEENKGIQNLLNEKEETTTSTRTTITKEKKKRMKGTIRL